MGEAARVLEPTEWDFFVAYTDLRDRDWPKEFEWFSEWAKLAEWREQNPEVQAYCTFYAKPKSERHEWINRIGEWREIITDGLGMTFEEVEQLSL